MSIRKLRFIANRIDTAQRVDLILADWLPQELGRPVSKAKGRKLIMAGAVRINGRPVRNAAQSVIPGATIEAFVDTGKLFDDATSRDKTFELSPDRILLEDEDLIIIDKPPGLPSQPTVDESRDSLLAALRRFLSHRDDVETPYIGVHHRLDRDTSGIVMFTKTRRVNAKVGELFSKHRVIKTYQALTVPQRKLQSRWTVKNYLGKISARSRPSRYGAVESDGEFAETAFKVIETYSAGLWIEAIPKTGRTHQIRVHLAEMGLPILGDGIYGSNSKIGLAPRLMLHAARLSFPHPATGIETSVESPLPADFRKCLDRIRS
ncbi:MAG TPA: RluA family pseudouridine synthase [Terriglobia bacterium]|nr:RluA family pseudouridine synthase [Terriglobia bacterium]